MYQDMKSRISSQYGTFISYDEISLFPSIDEKLLRIFLKILEPLMPLIKQINEEDSSEMQMEKAGVHTKGDDTQSGQETTTSSIKQSKEEKKSSEKETAQKSDEQDEDANEGDDDNDNDDEISEKAKRHLMMLYRVLQGFTFDVMFSIHVVNTFIKNYPFLVFFSYQCYFVL